MLNSRGCLTGKTVLIVENEWLIAADIRRALAREGALVLQPVAAVGQALRLISETYRIDAAVLDIHLADGASVYPVAEALRALDVPFVFATGYDWYSVQRDFADIPHLTKPFLPSAVAQALATAATVSQHIVRYG